MITDVYLADPIAADSDDNNGYNIIFHYLGSEELVQLKIEDDSGKIICTFNVYLDELYKTINVLRGANLNEIPSGGWEKTY